MKKEKVIYTITSNDVMNVSDEINIPVSLKDLSFIEDKIENFFGSQWHSAVEYALIELERNKKNKQSI